MYTVGVYINIYIYIWIYIYNIYIGVSMALYVLDYNCIFCIAVDWYRLHFW